MERLRIGDVVAVSRHLTAEHIDVTDAPLRYAAPKPAWIDGYAKMRRLAEIDDADRMARRRVHSNAVVGPEEILDCALEIRTARVTQPRPDAAAIVAGWREAAAAMFKRRACR